MMSAHSVCSMKGQSIKNMAKRPEITAEDFARAAEKQKELQAGVLKDLLDKKNKKKVLTPENNVKVARVNSNSKPDYFPDKADSHKRIYDVGENPSQKKIGQSISNALGKMGDDTTTFFTKWTEKIVAASPKLAPFGKAVISIGGGVVSATAVPLEIVRAYAAEKTASNKIDQAHDTTNPEEQTKLVDDAYRERGKSVGILYGVATGLLIAGAAVAGAVTAPVAIGVGVAAIAGSYVIGKVAGEASAALKTNDTVAKIREQQYRPPKQDPHDLLLRGGRGVDDSRHPYFLNGFNQNHSNDPHRAAQIGNMPSIDMRDLKPLGPLIIGEPQKEAAPLLQLAALTQKIDARKFPYTDAHPDDIGKPVNTPTNSRSANQQQQPEANPNQPVKNNGGLSFT